MGPRAEILPPDSLKGISVGISVSQSPDLARLGLTESHFRLALGEITRSVLVLGGSIAYGGHLDPTGYTAFLLAELKRYGRRDRPLSVCLPWPEHRRVPLSQLLQQATDLGLYASITYLNPDGEPIDPSLNRSELPATEADPLTIMKSLTAMRLYMGSITQGRVLIGGKRQGFQGNLPGLMEEALVAFEKEWPVFLAGGFGGVTLDIVRAIRPEDAEWLPSHADSPPADPRWSAGIARLLGLTAKSTWTGLNNGLADDENRRLAATHRPSDIAALVSMGLGRLVENGVFRNGRRT